MSVNSEYFNGTFDLYRFLKTLTNDFTFNGKTEDMFNRISDAVFKDFLEDMNCKRYHLLYNGFLNTIIVPILILGHIEFIKTKRNEKIYSLWNTLLNVLKENRNISKRLLFFLKNDVDSFLKDYIKNGISETYLSKEGFFEFPFSLRDNVDSENLVKISDYFKNKIKMEPLVYKMIEVAKIKSDYESEYYENFRNSFPKIVTINLPWRSSNRYGVRAGSRWPFTMPINNATTYVVPPKYVPFPFFLAYTTSLLKKNGFYCIMIDAIAEGLDEENFFDKIVKIAPDLILIETATASLLNDLTYTKKIKEYLPHCKIIFSGTHVSYFKKEFLKENSIVDGIIIGEPEEAFLNISKHFKKNKNFNGILQKGFLYYDEAGCLKGNSERTDLVDIDKLPYPERLTLPVYNYNDLFAGMVYPSLQIHSSRGCPFGCIYCVYPQVLYMSRTYRTREPFKVVEEIEDMVKVYGFKSFYFDDDTFNIGKERVLAICEEIKKRGLDKIPWAAMARADTSDYETLKAMKDAGLVSIKFGVESGVQQLVDNCGKGLDLRKAEETVKWCRELGIKYHLTFTFGLPGETNETINKTIDYAIKLSPDSCQFSLTTPFPGTRYFELAKSKGLLLTEDWEKYDGNRFTVIKGESLTKDDLEDAVKKAYEKWYDFKKRKEETK